MKQLFQCSIDHILLGNLLEWLLAVNRRQKSLGYGLVSKINVPVNTCGGVAALCDEWCYELCMITYNAEGDESWLEQPAPISAISESSAEFPISICGRNFLGWNLGFLVCHLQCHSAWKYRLNIFHCMYCTNKVKMSKCGHTCTVSTRLAERNEVITTDTKLKFEMAKLTMNEFTRSA